MIDLENNQLINSFLKYCNKRETSFLLDFTCDKKDNDDMQKRSEKKEDEKKEDEKKESEGLLNKIRILL